MSLPFIEENDQTAARRAHLEALRELVGNVYPNKFERSELVEPGREDTITSIVEKFRAFEPQTPPDGRPSPEELDNANRQLNDFSVRLAGRIASPPRVMGKAAFVHISDGSSRLQLYIRRDDVIGVHNDKLGGDLQIKPLKVGFAAYYESAGRVDLMDLHKDEKPVFISGKDVRKTLVEGKEVDPRIMRPSTSRILAEAMKGLA